MSASWKPGQKKISKEPDDDDLNDILDGLLADDGPSKKPANQGPSGSGKKPASRAGGADMDFYKDLAAVAGDVTESDISEADPVMMAQSMDDLDDMDAALFTGKSKAPTSQKPGGATKPATLTSATKTETSKDYGKDKPLAKPKKYDYDFDEDDPLKGLISDEEDSFATKKKPGRQSGSGGANRHPTPTEKQDSVAASVKTAKTTDTDSKPKIESAPVNNKRGSFAKRGNEISFDDDDVLGTMGLEDGPSKASKSQGNDEPKTGKSIMDSLLGKSSVSQHLERPGTGEKKKEFVLDKKYTKPQNEKTGKEEDFLFGSYTPSAGSSRPSSRRAVRFQNEDDDPMGLKKRPQSATMSRVRGSDPPNTAGSDPGDWLGITTEEKAKPRPKSAGDVTANSKSSKSSSAADWLGLGTDSDKESDAKNDMDDWLGLSTKQRPQSSMGSEVKKPASADSQKSDSSRAATADTVRLNSAYKQGLSDDEFLAMGEADDPDIFNKPESLPTEPLQKSLPDPLSQDLFNPPPKAEDASVFNWESSRTRAPLMQRPSTRSGNRDAASVPALSASLPVSSVSPATAAGVSSAANSSDGLAATLHHLQSVELGERQSRTAFSPPARTHHTPSSPKQATMSQPLPTTTFMTAATSAGGTSSSSMEALRQQQQLILQQKQMELQVEIQRQQEEWRQQEMRQQQAAQQAQQQLLQQQLMSLQQTGPFTSSMLGSSLQTAGSQSDLEAKIKRLEIEKEQMQMIIDSLKQRHQEEVSAVEASYKSRLDIQEESFQRRETRLKEENELLMTQNMNKLKQAEQEKADLMQSLYKRLEESDRDKYSEIQRLKETQRRAIEDLQSEHVQTLSKLKQVKLQEMEAVSNTQTHSQALMAVVDQIHANASELGNLQQKVGQQHSTQLDNREAAAKLMDENLKTLQDRLHKQQREYEQERARLNGLITKLEMQLTEQTRHIEEEKWRVRQEENKLQALQSSTEQEKAIMMEKLQRQRNDLQNAKDNLIEEQKTLLAQLCEERRALAEQRSQFELSQKLHQDQQHRESIKTAQVIAERDGAVKQIADEKAAIQVQLQELQQQKEKLSADQTALEHEKYMLNVEKQKLEQLAVQLKNRSKEIEEMCVSAADAREEGQSALLKARQIESEQNMRLQSIQAQLHSLREKEKSIAQERLVLAKEKQVVEVRRANTVQQPNFFMDLPTQQSMLLGTSTANVSMMPASMNIGNTSASMMAAANLPLSQSPSVLVPNLANTLSNVGQMTSAMQVDHSVRMWKLSAEKDKAYLAEEGMFLEALKHSPYSAKA